MKLSSKSILSPSRSREPPQMSLSSSSSRRLGGSNGNSKGGQASPMFPTGGKKRGSGFENPEPSSPKVTCIGQVRVKSKKQGRKMRARSKRIGEASFRKTDQTFQVAANPDLSRQNSQSFQYQNHQNLQQECLPHRNQRWVHLPWTICEALRAFGAEFSCLFPCRSSCMSGEREKVGAAEGEEGSSGGGHGRESSCGAALGRWLVSLQEGDGKGREIELVMGEEEAEDRTERSQRRHVFQDINIDDVEQQKNKDFLVEEEEEKGRVSICIPPKNALLLMRCRSDPVKMAALANRFWEPTVQKDEDEAEKEEENDEEEKQVQIVEDKQVQRDIEVEDSNCESSKKEVAFVASEERVIPEEEGYEIESRTTNPEANQEKQQVKEDAEGGNKTNEKDETFSVATTATPPEVEADLENPETHEESSKLASSPALSARSEPQNNQARSEGSTERENGSKLERESGTLPECLLLMMCEPKLSMEVSRETWVCTTDFTRWLPERPAGKTAGGDHQPKKRVAVDSKPPPPPLQPPRWSCSFPATAVATVMEQKGVGSNGYEPLVLSRCKSEPRSSAKLAHETCFWNNRKLEPHPPPARLGVGAAGIGF